jgi:precorrin-3B C17-methyltransferase
MNVADRGTGTLYVVGLGPGAPGLLTPDASAALDAADTVVGYRGYLDRIAPRLVGKAVVGRTLGEEVERAKTALELAEEGRTVALVSSGDAGIYGMGGLVCELAAGRATPPEIVMVPGVTAACAAAARLGAPLAHDWACVSLSDLLTPWETVVRRVESAARADFVLVLYNPASRARARQLPEVARRLLHLRDPATPVGLVENAYRPGEHVAVVRLDELATARVSMFTTVIVGSSRTFLAHGRMVTPRIGAARSDVESSLDPGPESDGPGPGILAESLAIIEGALGSDPADPAERAVVRRMVHASADFDFAATARFAPGAIAAAVASLRAGRPVVADVEMLRAGIRHAEGARQGIAVACALDEPATRALAAATGLTRSAAGIRRAAAQVGDGALVAIGNAPTALVEALRLIDKDGWQPACVVGIPVGFVGVEEAKRRLVELGHVPFITCLGRKGGTAVTAAAVNALFELAGDPLGTPP